MTRLLNELWFISDLHLKLKQLTTKQNDLINLITSHLGSWDPISEAQTRSPFHPGKGVKHAKTKENTNLTKE